MKYQGEFYIDCAGVGGWAKCLENSEPLWVEILADGLSAGVARCDLPQHEGNAFWLPLPEFLLTGETELVARVANTDIYLPHKMELPESRRSDGGLTGDIFIDRGVCLTGWLLDKNDPDATLKVRVLEKGKEITSGIANMPNPLLEADGHAFKIFLPMAILDGQEHRLEIRDHKNRLHPGSPVHVCAIPEKVSTWLERCKKLSDGERDVLINLVRYMENRAAGTLDFAYWPIWKKGFPPRLPTGKKVFSLNIRENGQKSVKPQALGEQQGCQIRKPGDNADYTLFIRPCEKLHNQALAKMVDSLERTGAALAYADGESPEGKPLLKPAWDRDAFLARDYLGPVLVKGKLGELGEDGEDYGALRIRLLLEAEKSGGIAHIAEALVVEMPVENTVARCREIESLTQAKCEKNANLPMDAPLRIHYPLARRPEVSIIIPTRDQAPLLERCLNSLSMTEWDKLEILVLDNDTAEPEALDLLRDWGAKPHVRVLRQPGVFNYAAMNNRAVEEARGELVCFLNNDTEMLAPEWLAEMVSLLLSRPDNGCVGAKLLWPNGLVQHGGVVIGLMQLAGHVGNGWLDDEGGYMWRNQFAQQFSAVTAACMLTPRNLFREMGGFDARAFAVNFNDTDYCLRLRKAGKRVLWTPHAKLIHHESASRGKEDSPAKKARIARETDMFRKHWGAYRDPFYNPSLTLSAMNDLFQGLAIPPERNVIRICK